MCMSCISTSKLIQARFALKKLEQIMFRHSNVQNHKPQKKFKKSLGQSLVALPVLVLSIHEEDEKLTVLVWLWLYSKLIVL